MYPKKFLGQHFLKDEKLVEWILEIGKVSKKDTILEIGPGKGILTRRLAEMGGKVLAVEKDWQLVEYLKRALKGFTNLKIVHQDALFFDPHQLSNYKLIANLPYNITSPIIRKFLTAQNPPQLLVLMVQKEVAERLVAKPGNSDRGLLTLMVEMFGRAEIVEIVPASAFWPQPNVESAIIKIQNQSASRRTKIPREDQEKIMKLAKIGFAHKRQQLINSLSSGLHLPKVQTQAILEKAKINPMLRAEDLSIDDWQKLSKAISLK